MALWSYDLVEAAREHGFELAGIAPALPLAEDYQRYQEWVEQGHAGRMSYLTGHRADMRSDPRSLLPSAKSILCVGKLYNTPYPNDSTPEEGWISRYAWGEDYHDTMRRDLENLVADLHARAGPFESRICIDTAPLLERSYARRAGLGWIGRNSCLINQQHGSWFLLGEVLLSLELEPGEPPPDRCGTCARCIEACPTQAIVPDGQGGWKLDATLCISYFTIELKGAIPEESRQSIGNHIFGCDICQDVCPWNGRAPATAAAQFQPAEGRLSPGLENLLHQTAAEFRLFWKGSPVTRARYAGFLRNVSIAMGNSGAEKFVTPLERLAESEEETVREHAIWALRQITGTGDRK